MGVKKIKEHYRIEHIVQKRADNVLIGSAYVSDLLTVSSEGRIVERSSIGTRNDDLQRYVREIEADPAQFAALLAAEDVFEKSVKAYTWDGAEIVEVLCEEFGWPNVTHDGRLMYENTFFLSRKKAAAAAKRDAASGVLSWRRELARAEKRLAEARRYLEEGVADLAKLDADYPSVEIDAKYREDVA